MYQRIPRLTLEEYLALDEASARKWEYEDGQVYCLADFPNNHAIIAASVCAALSRAFGQRRGMLMVAPKVIVTARQHYYPDLVVSCDEREDGNDSAVRYPLLIAEVLSPSTEGHDRGSGAASRMIRAIRPFLWPRWASLSSLRTCTG